MSYDLRPAPLFGQVLTSQAAQIKHTKISEKIFNTLETPSLKNRLKSVTDRFSWLNWFNWTTNDWLSRAMTLILYLSQGYTAAKQNKHKWETIGRNTVVFLGTIGIGFISKSDRFGATSILNTFMRPKGKPYDYFKNDLTIFDEHRKDVLKQLGDIQQKTTWDKAIRKEYKSQQKLLLKLTKKTNQLQAKLNQLIHSQGSESAAKEYTGSWYHRLLNKVRLDQNYYDILKNKQLDIRVSKSDYRKNYWASLNSIDLETILGRIEKLKAQKKAGQLAGNEVTELKTLSRFMTQLSTFKIISTALMSMLTIYVIGIFLINLVFKFIAPRDHDFNPEKTPKAIKRKLKEEKLRTEGKLPPETTLTHTLHSPHTSPSPFSLPGKTRNENNRRAMQNGGLF